MDTKKDTNQPRLMDQLNTEDFRMAHLAAIVESSDDAIISKTLDGIIISWNSGARRIFGYTADEIIGRPVTLLIPPDRLSEEPAILEQLKRGERVDHFETKRITKDGRLLDISLTISPVKDRHGVIIGASKIARDITDQKEAERRLREAEEHFRHQLEWTVAERTAELQKSNAELEQYAYITSHDLQEPLRKIRNFTELLKMHIHDEAAVEKYFEKINTTAQRMSTLIKDVLNYSRLSQVDTMQAEMDLNDVLQDVLTDFDLLITQKKAVITADHLPVIKGDPQQLRQLFGNLLSNALKFSERAPQIRIHCWVTDQEQVQLVFKDNGIGFDQQYAEQVFIAFKRLNNRQLYSGSGIGLALCKKVVERHGGSIRAESHAGEGSSFTILLPLK